MERHSVCIPFGDAEGSKVGISIYKNVVKRESNLSDWAE